MRWVAILAALAGAPAAAFEIDYAGLFALHADKVQVLSPTERQLEMEGDVTLTEIRVAGETVAYLGMDRGNGGAVGCSYWTVVEVSGMAMGCPGMLTDAETGTLNGMADALIDFIGLNTYPPQSTQTVREEFETHVGQYAAYFQAKPDQCPSAYNQLDVLEFARAFVGVKALELLTENLSTPRLPVNNPCR